MSMDDVAMSTAPPPYEKLTDPSYDISQDKSPEQKQIEADQAKEDFNLAALKDHPGWQQIKGQMEADVESFRMLKNIDLKKYKNDELGELVRSEHMVAEKLQAYLNKIDNAVRAVESGRNK